MHCPELRLSSSYPKAKSYLNYSTPWEDSREDCSHIYSVLLTTDGRKLTSLHKSISSLFLQVEILLLCM